MQFFKKNSGSLKDENPAALSLKIAEWGLRAGISGTFLGHGIFALGVKPNWIPLITAFNFSEETASNLLPLIGVMDVTVALFTLLRPVRCILIWACLWAFAAALSRVVAGEPVWEFVERAANWASPLALLVLRSASEKKSAEKYSAINTSASFLQRLYNPSVKL